MNLLALAAWCLGVATWLLMPDPRTRISAITETQRESSRIQRLLAGKPGAAPPRLRGLLGFIAGSLSFLLIPGWVGLIAAGVAGCGIYLGSGQFSNVPSDAPARSELAHHLDLMAVCLEAGTPGSRAVSIVTSNAPPATASILSRVEARQKMGMADDDAWQVLEDHPIWGQAAAQMIRSARSGTAASSTLRVHAEEARRHWVENVTKASKSVGVKSVIPLMACFLPAFMLVGVVPLIGALIVPLLPG